MNKIRAANAILVGTTFLVTFLLFIPVAEKLFLDWFPSGNEDDVRFDLFFPVFGSACLISCLVSFVVAKVASRITKTKLSNRSFGRFLLLVPVIFLVAYAIVVAILLSFLAIGFHNEPLDRAIVYFVVFATMISGYYLIMRDSRPSNKA